MSSNNNSLINATLLNVQENVERMGIETEENEFNINFDEVEKKKNRSKTHLFFSLSKRVPKDVKRYCGICRQHGLLMQTRGHVCTYKECKCAKCKLVRSRRQVMSRQIRLRRAQDKRFQRTNEPKKADVFPLVASSLLKETTRYNSKSNLPTLPGSNTSGENIFNNDNLAQRIDDAVKNMCYFCQKCKNHGLLVWKKQHKRQCPFVECECDKCDLIETRRRLDQHIKKRKTNTKNNSKLSACCHSKQIKSNTEPIPFRESPIIDVLPSTSSTASSINCSSTVSSNSSCERTSTSSSSTSPLPISQFLASSTFDFSVCKPLDNNNIMQNEQSLNILLPVSLNNNVSINANLPKNITSFYPITTKPTTSFKSNDLNNQNIHLLEPQKYIYNTPNYENAINSYTASSLLQTSNNSNSCIGTLNKNNLLYNEKLFESMLSYYKLLSTVEKQKNIEQMPITNEKLDCFNSFMLNNTIPKDFYLTPTTIGSISASPTTASFSLSGTTATTLSTATNFSKLCQSKMLFNSQYQTDSILVDNLLTNPIIQMSENIPKEIMSMSNRELEQLLALIALTNSSIQSSNI